MLLPLLLALLGQVLALLTPLDTIWGNVAHAGLLAGWPWLMALQVPWSLGSIAFGQRRALSLAAIGIGAIGVGRPIEVAEPAGGLLLVSANVNSYPPPGTVTAVAEDRLASLGADAIVVIEQRVLQVPGMVRVADNFGDPLPRISHGSAIFCRRGLACAAWVSPEIGSATSRMPVALVRLEGGLCWIGIHGPPPAPYDPTGLLPYVEEVAAHIESGRLAQEWGPCEVGDAALVAGDLNQVPGSRAYRQLQSPGLVDVQAGSGLFSLSWPSGGGWWNLPFFRLDQVLVGDVAVGRVQHTRLDGSDHQALVFRARAGG